MTDDDRCPECEGTLDNEGYCEDCGWDAICDCPGKEETP